MIAGLAIEAGAQNGTVVAAQKISDTAGNFTEPMSNVDEFGGTVCSLGDLDGAGASVAAIAVGAAGDDDGGTDRGCIYILFLDAGGSVLSHQKISDTAGGFTAPLANEDGFGSSVAFLGDLDGAGPAAAAIAVGAAGDDDGGEDRGCVYVLFLSATGTCLSFQTISDTQGNFTATIDDLDEFGAALGALGDLDGAGPSAAAVAVGVALDDDGGSARGAAYILFLSSTGSTLSHKKISDTQGNFSEPLANTDEFGSSVAGLGDLDGEGPSVAALAVGAIGDDDGGSGRGCVYVFFLDAAGEILSFQKISDTAGGFAEPLGNLDEFGGAVADLGDADGSGPSVRAMAVGAIGDDDGGSGRGCVYVLYLAANGTVLAYQKISDTQGNLPAGLLGDGDEFGGSAAGLGDINGTADGALALAVGCAFDDDGGADRGAVYVLHLEGPAATDAAPSPGALGLHLSAARPNPFNPQTTIAFAVETPGRLALDVWDASGRRVRRLADADFTAGQHRVVWDGLDDHGRAVASGTYYYALSVRGQVVTAARTAVLLK
jgi:hypothetical protein